MRQSYADMFQEAMVEAKKEIDRYFNQKIKEYENPPPSFYEDPYPEELYDGMSSPHLYYMQHVLDEGWDVILFNRKLMAYKPAWVFRGQEFFDKERTLPVSKGWEFHTDKYTNIKLSCWHSEKCRELKMSWKEYFEVYVKEKTPYEKLQEALKFK